MQHNIAYHKRSPAKSNCGSESPSLGNAEPAPFDKGASGWCKFGDLYADLNPHPVHAPTKNDKFKIPVR